jgi:hypothetical protein
MFVSNFLLDHVKNSQLRLVPAWLINPIQGIDKITDDLEGLYLSLHKTCI